jgi:hypothetical protein
MKINNMHVITQKLTKCMPIFGGVNIPDHNVLVMGVSLLQFMLLICNIIKCIKQH